MPRLAKIGGSGEHWDIARRLEVRRGDMGVPEVGRESEDDCLPPAGP